MTTPEKGTDRRRVTREVGRYTGFGLAWALSVLLFLLIGYWLDGKLGTLPWLTVAGAFVGAAGGFVSLVRGLTSAAEAAEREEAEP